MTTTTDNFGSLDTYANQKMLTNSEPPVANNPPTENMQTIDTNSKKISSKVSVKLTGRVLSLSRLHLTGNDLPAMLAKLEKKLGKQHQTNLPVIVSCDEPIDLVELFNHLWQLGLQPIGVVAGVLDEQARHHRIAIFPADGQKIDKDATDLENDSLDAKKTEDITAPTVDKPPRNQTLMDIDPQLFSAFSYDHRHAESSIAKKPVFSPIEGDMVCTKMVRSGQSINHVGGNLILTSSLNAGAEAITDYSLHIYGKAEGRIVAGATGDKNARIFCLRFNPSLVSVAGTYCLKENIPVEFLNQAVQVSYEENQGLVFTLMNSYLPKK